jgi:D-alanyl-lipoteichoic acid acyltransferase DltB (MBOAT superfamily)
LAIAAMFFLMPGARCRQLVLAASSGVFLYFCIPDAWSGLALVLFVLSGYAAAVVLRRRPSGLFLAVYVALLVMAFMFLKRYVLLRFLLPGWLLDHPISALGLSYILFRQIHYLVDTSQDQIPRSDLWSYLNYQFNLFGFLSGPIQRYQDFEERWPAMEPLFTTRYEVLRAVLRLCVGIIKVSLISAFLLTTFESQRAYFLLASHALPMGQAKIIAKFVTMFYSYPLYLYFNFSGYCDIVIPAAGLLGVNLPENFNRPYLSRNVIDYWTRFHQSLGYWIRDYLFTPLYKAVATRWTDKSQLLVFPCYFVAFVLAGVWHGSTLNFAFFGLLHGLGVSGAKLWEFYLVRRGGRKGLKAYLASRPIRFASVALTLNFICVTMLFFPSSLHETFTVLCNFVRFVT